MRAKCCIGNILGKQLLVRGELGSSVNIVSGYGLNDRAIDVRSPADAKGFFL
jgi:hypothetical protein